MAKLNKISPCLWFDSEGEDAARPIARWNGGGWTAR